MKIDSTLNTALTILHKAFANTKILRDEHESVRSSKHFHGKIELIFKHGNLATARVVYETVKFDKEEL